MKPLERERLVQAGEALGSALACREAGMDPGTVLTSLYYAFYYPVLALMNEGRVPEVMQSVTIALFERRFIDTGILNREYGDALRRIFESKPSCDGGRTAVSGDEVLALMALARSFQEDVRAHLEMR